MADKNDTVCVFDASTATAAIYSNVDGTGFKRTEYASGLKTDPAFGKGVPPAVGAAGDYVAALQLMEVDTQRRLGPAQADIHVKVTGWNGKTPVGSCEVNNTDGTTATLPLVDKSKLQMAPALTPGGR